MSSAASTNTRRQNRIGEHALEFVAVILLGVATLGSAWCAYQSTRWNGDQADDSRRASDSLVEGSRLFGLATQAVSYDSNVVGQYAGAVVAGNQQLKAFIRQTLVRPGFLPVLDRWEAQLAAGNGPPVNLLSDQDYLNEQLGPYRAAQDAAERATAEADEAGKHSDDYVLLTLVFASALFFSGVTSSFRMRTARLMMLAAAALLMAYAAGQLAGYPIA